MKDLTGSIQQFMNWAESHLANRKVLCKIKDFYRQRRKGKEWVVSGKDIFLEEAGV